MFNKLSEKKIYKKLGYSIDQEGILTRFLREGDAWKNHIEKTKTFIKESYQGKGYKSIAVFGSGWLLDLPIDDIIADFSEVYLFDIIHPIQITHKYRKNSHVHFIETDITGGVAKKVYQIIYKKNNVQSSDLCKVEGLSFQYPKQFDFVVSLNILNQLDILLVDAIQEHLNIDPHVIESFRIVIQKEHIRMLQNYNYCLISDWEKHSFNINTNQETITPLIFIPEPKALHKEEWLWTFDSQGLYEDSHNVTFQVKAFFKPVFKITE